MYKKKKKKKKIVIPDKVVGCIVHSMFNVFIPYWLTIINVFCLDDLFFKHEIHEITQSMQCRYL